MSCLLEKKNATIRLLDTEKNYVFLCILSMGDLSLNKCYLYGALKASSALVFTAVLHGLKPEQSTNSIPQVMTKYITEVPLKLYNTLHTKLCQISLKVPNKFVHMCWDMLSVKWRESLPTIHQYSFYLFYILTPPEYYIYFILCFFFVLMWSEGIAILH